MKLVIVESPAKCETIKRYLGEGYNVQASLGHIRDLVTRGKGGLGVDIEHDFTPTYAVSKDKRDKVEELKKLAKKADEVIIATDPDREGEAIAWHLADVLGLDIATTKRLEFHEITRDSINEAIQNPRHIDMKLVQSQETRRILDRIIGFKLSNLVFKKIRSKSAGRVQSATLKMIREREEEIAKFEPKEYWLLDVKTSVGKKEYSIKLIDKKGGDFAIKTREKANLLFDKLGDELVVKNITTHLVNKQPKEPFRTSTLQQEAFNRLKFQTSRTQSIAQKLYEGINVGDEHVGLITYMRTDSTRLSPTFIERAKSYITDRFGKNYVGHPQKLKSIAQMQDAHEAIRPTSTRRTPESIAQYISKDEYNLYKLIYNRAVGSLMKAKTEEVMDITLESNGVFFTFELARTVFDGYEVLDKKKDESESFPHIEVGQTLPLIHKEVMQKFTQPPSHYNEAKIVSLMEEVGIGRPSTYAQTIKLLIDRKYTIRKDGLVLITEQGNKTVVVLNKYFPGIMNLKYTATMEDKLDEIADGQLTRLEVLNHFYQPFEAELTAAKEKMYSDPEVPTGEMCPNCGKPLVYKEGSNGPFVGCSNYPKCKFTKSEEKEQTIPTGKYCPKCGRELLEKRHSNGQVIIECCGAPKCDYREIKEPSKNSDNFVKKCPKCGGNLIKKKGKYGYFLGCDHFPNCNYMEKIKKKSSYHYHKK